MKRFNGALVVLYLVTLPFWLWGAYLGLAMGLIDARLNAAFFMWLFCYVLYLAYPVSLFVSDVSYIKKKSAILVHLPAVHIVLFAIVLKVTMSLHM